MCQKIGHDATVQRSLSLTKACKGNRIGLVVNRPPGQGIIADNVLLCDTTLTCPSAKLVGGSQAPYSHDPSS